MFINSTSIFVNFIFHACNVTCGTNYTLNTCKHSEFITNTLTDCFRLHLVVRCYYRTFIRSFVRSFGRFYSFCLPNFLCVNSKQNLCRSFLAFHTTRSPCGPSQSCSYDGGVNHCKSNGCHQCICRSAGGGQQSCSHGT